MISGEHALWDAALQVSARRAARDPLAVAEWAAGAEALRRSMRRVGISYGEAVKALHSFAKVWSR